MHEKRYDVCAAVVSDLTFDARVWREVRSLAAAGYRVRLLGCYYDETRRTLARENGVDVFRVALGSRSGDVSVLRRARTLLRLWLEILKTRARVYHAHNIHVGPPLWLVARVRRAAVIYDAHELYGERDGDSPRHRVAAFVERRIERFLVRHSDRVITTNRSRAEVLKERHGRDEIEVLQNVPWAVNEVAPRDPGYPPDSTILLYQGGIYAEGRAFKQTIEALTTLDDIHLVVIGFGRQADLMRLHQWAAEAGVAHRVHVLPPRPFDELVQTAAAANIGLVPITPTSLNEYLGDTNKLFEYLMAGLPVVASDLPEIRRVVMSGQPPPGELFDPESSASIGDAVRRMLSDRTLYEQRRSEARRLALSAFNWDIEQRRLLALYRTLSSSSSATAGADSQEIA
jgi:glycosyltransferase involved in cell wall biosynthesis